MTKLHPPYDRTPYIISLYLNSLFRSFCGVGTSSNLISLASLTQVPLGHLTLISFYHPYTIVLNPVDWIHV